MNGGFEITEPMQWIGLDSIYPFPHKVTLTDWTIDAGDIELVRVLLDMPMKVTSQLIFQVGLEEPSAKNFADNAGSIICTNIRDVQVIQDCYYIYNPLPTRESCSLLGR